MHIYNKFFRRFFVTLLSVFLAAFAIQAQGQDDEDNDDSDDSQQQIEEITVTAQRVEENIQSVPISVSTFNEHSLEQQQVINPSDIQINVPNVSFTAGNFGGSSLSIRGVGSLIQGSAAEAGVSAHINEIPILFNLNTQEFFDMERVEILRGPQGTLFGRNATGGAINFVTNKPDFDKFSAYFDSQFGTEAHNRLTGMVNFPIGEGIAARLAVMTLKRDGYTENLAGAQGVKGVDDNIDGRDQWAARLTIAWEFSETASAWFLHNRQHEDSDRTRISNQVCERNTLPTSGCTPNGFGFDAPYLGATTSGVFAGAAGVIPLGTSGADGFVEYKYPRPRELDLRTVHVDFEPVFKEIEHTYAFGTDYLFQGISFRLLGAVFQRENISQQDYLMEVGATLGPTALNPSGLWPISRPAGRSGDEWTGGQCSLPGGTAGIFGGCILEGIDQTRYFSFDRNDGEGDGWVVEGILNADIDDRTSYLLGVTSFYHERKTGYYVFANPFDIVARFGAPLLGLPPIYPSFFFNSASPGGEPGRIDEGSAVFGEVYFDINDTMQLTAGLRYNEDEKSTEDTSVLFNAINHIPVLQTSVYPGIRAQIAALLGVPIEFLPLQTALAIAYRAGLLAENHLINLNAATGVYWSRAMNLLLGPLASGAPEIALARYYGVPQAQIDAALLTPAYSTERIAISNQIPIVPGFNESRALTNSPDNGSWNALTGRVSLDVEIAPDILVYGSISTGYKPGGVNAAISEQFQDTSGFTFDREDVLAFEAGTKSYLLDGRAKLNGALFTYQYSGLQVTRIKNNAAINENIDANIWGLEAEGWIFFDEFPNVVFDYAYSYLNTSVDGTSSLDPLNRTAGNNDWVLLNNIDAGALTGINYIARKDQITQELINQALAAGATIDIRNGLSPVSVSHPANENGVSIPAYFSRRFLTALGVDTLDGLETNLDGNALPNSPEHTIKLGGNFVTPVSSRFFDGNLTLRFDLYWQSKSFSREFNTPGDQIDSWTQMNASATFESNDGKIVVRGWVRNLENNNNVTGMYLTSDTSGLFRNYFLTEPRIAGISLRYSLD